MEEKIKQQSVDRLDIRVTTINTLKENNIRKIYQLTKKSKADLKNLGLDSTEYNKIEVELQLLGLCLKNSL